METTEISIANSVGNSGGNRATDIATVQFLINTARARMNQPLITLDCSIGNETIGAISDFQQKSFGSADGRVDVNGRSFRRLREIYVEPKHIDPTKTYQTGKNNKYRVTVGADGRIFVQPNDWLSKYSAAIYGNYYEIFAFGRLTNGEMRFITNRNLIRAGEVIYHIDTWMRYMSSKNKIPVEKKIPITDLEKKKITEQAINQEYRLKGDYGIKIISKIDDILGKSGAAIEVASYLLPILEGLSTGLALVAVPFDIYSNFQSYLNASDTDLRLYGLRGAAYAVTAWAFNREQPTRSDKILGNIASQWGKYGTIPPARRMALDKAWRDASDAAVRLQEQFAAEKLGATVFRNYKIDSWKASLMALGDDSPSNTSYLLMKQLGEKYLTGTWNASLRAWEGTLDIRYPD